MGLGAMLALLWDRLRHPERKPEWVEEIERRQDAVEERLDRLARAYRRADASLGRR